MPTLIEDLRGVLWEIDEGPLGDRICTFLEAYDALAPDWSQAPEWAQWYAIDASGEGFWYAERPVLRAILGDWINVSAWNAASTVDLPLGLDWRLCLWRRPQEGSA